MPLATNLARQKCFVSAVCGLIQAKNVQLPQIAKHFNPTRSNEANERRLQAFLTNYPFDFERIALLMVLFLPRGRVTLCLDRTEWDFGKCQVNILMLTGRCAEVAVPCIGNYSTIKAAIQPSRTGSRFWRRPLTY